MEKGHSKNGFSLTEVLLAVGTLAIGMIFIGGTFLVGIHFSTIATERTIAAVVADEAFAKIKLYDVNLGSPLWQMQDPNIFCVNFNDVSGIWPVPIDPNEFAYPSTETDLVEKRYFWSALCRRVAPDPNRLVQVTVFVSRKAGSRTEYRDPLNPITGIVGYPMPVKVDVSVTANANELEIEAGKENWINDGYTIVDNTTGQIYRVMKRYAPPDDDSVILLDRNWIGSSYPTIVWLVPPAPSGGRYPCIAVYQTEMRF